MRITLELTGRNSVAYSDIDWWEFTQKSNPPSTPHIKLYLTPRMWQDAGKPTELDIELPDYK
jgi:hypothetical protein